MSRTTKTVNVDRNNFHQFRKMADGFYQGAITEMNELRWNASGVLIIHAAISYADAITVKFGGIRSRGDNHQDVVRLIDSLIPVSKERNNALNQLERLIAHKSSVSYSGKTYDKKDIEKLFKHLERFKEWATKIIH